jgi:putative ABC transport system ATP-binding protein
MTSLVRARGLTKQPDAGRGGAPILSGVDLTIEAGEFVCIMGPSGSGKTSLLHLLSGLDQPTEGAVEIDGVDLFGLSERERTLRRREQVGYVFQFFNLLPNLTVAENVGLPIAIRGEQPKSQRDKIDQLLERLGIADRREALPHQLSGGEMQRTSIARALVGGQPLLLCDEPTGNLSQQAGLEVMHLLRECVQNDGRSVVLVTHNPRDATFADRVQFLVDGHLAGAVTLHGPDIQVESVHQALASLAI